MNRQRIHSNYSLLVFVFFIAGGILVSLVYADFPDLWSAQPISGAYGLLIVPVGLSFFLAMTVFGVFLLPFCSLSCGALIAYLAQNMLLSGNDYSEYRDICAFLCVLVPAFFAVWDADFIPGPGSGSQGQAAGQKTVQVIYSCRSGGGRCRRAGGIYYQ